jgi:hypothetical protein
MQLLLLFLEEIVIFHVKFFIGASMFQPHTTVAIDAEDAPNKLLSVLDLVVVLVDSVDSGLARHFCFVAIKVFRVDFSDE